MKEKSLFWIHVWMFPQNLLGLLLLWIFRKKKTFMESYRECRVYAIESRTLSGLSLGRYIILNRGQVQDNKKYREAIGHEYGHFRQGRIFGIFYLLAIGIPSVLNHLRSRKNKRVFDSYYQRYPEKWADKLGGVKR